MNHVCPTIGPSMLCAECTPGQTIHFPVWFAKRRRPQDIIFRRQGYAQGSGDGKSFYWWWEWVPVTPLDGSAATREFVRSQR